MVGAARREEGRPSTAKGGRRLAFWRCLGQPCCAAVAPRTKSETTLQRAPQRPATPAPRLLPPPAVGVALPQPLTPSSAVVAEEARDELRPLPVVGRQRTSTASVPSQRSGRSSTSSAAGHARSTHDSLMAGQPRSARGSLMAGLAAAAGWRRRATFPSRTMGSLTAWQMLAADVQQDLDAGAAGAASGSAYSSSSADFSCLPTSSTHRPSTQIESQLIQEPSVDAEDDVVTRTLLLPRSTQPDGGAAAGSSDASDGGGDASSGSNTPTACRFESQFEVMGELGRGAFGRALKVRRRHDGATLCVKVLESDSMGAAERRMTRDEVRVLSAMAHPNIVLYHDCFAEGGRTYIIMEFCEEGDLEALLRARRCALLSEGEVMIKFVQLCLALQHVHSKGIIHRDVKTSNVFCTAAGILKLGDFGISKIMQPGKSHARTMVGTPYYFSPELVEDKPYSKKADVWAAGCVLYELATLQRPFRGSSVSAIAVKILRGTYAPLPEQYSPELRELVSALLRRKPDHRPSIDEVLEMDYVRFHMRRYRHHVQAAVEHRKLSYFRSLDMFHLESTCSSYSSGSASSSNNSTGSSSSGGSLAGTCGAAAVATSPGDAPVVVGVAAGPRSRASLLLPGRRQASRLSAVSGQLVLPRQAPTPAPAAAPVAAPAAVPEATVVVVSDTEVQVSEASSDIASALASLDAMTVAPRGTHGATAAAAVAADAGAAVKAEAVEAVRSALPAPAAAWGRAAPAAAWEGAASSPQPDTSVPAPQPGLPAAAPQAHGARAPLPKVTSFLVAGHLQAAAAAAATVAAAAAAGVGGGSMGGADGGIAGTSSSATGSQDGAAAAMELPAAAQPRVAQLELPALVHLRKLSSNIPGSPQSIYHAGSGLSSLPTAGSEACAINNADLAVAGAPLSTDADCACDSPAPLARYVPTDTPAPSPAHATCEPVLIGRAADSVGELARRAPELLAQVQHLLQRRKSSVLVATSGIEGATQWAQQHPGSLLAASLGSSGSSEGSAEGGEDGASWRRNRRAAVQSCLEELHTQMETKQALVCVLQAASVGST